jgi:putative transcriptional regulator
MQIMTKMSSKQYNPEDMPALRRLRKEAGLTQLQLAKLIPDKTKTKTLTQAAISRWESGEDEPELTIAQTKALCRALGKSLEEIPDDLGPPNRSNEADT